MAQSLILALGLVLVFEGLVLALAPHIMEEVLRFLAGLGPEQRRLIGALAITTGTILAFLALKTL